MARNLCPRNYAICEPTKHRRRQRFNEALQTDPKTTVTHNIRLNEKDLLDYPVSDRANLLKAEVMSISLSDCAEENELEPVKSHATRTRDEPARKRPRNNSTRTSSSTGSASSSPSSVFVLNPQILAGLKNKQAKYWTKEEVAQYLASSPMNLGPEVSQQFMRDCIDGQALYLLTLEHLYKDMGFPFSIALKVRYEIERLCIKKGFADVERLNNNVALLLEPLETDNSDTNIFILTPSTSNWRQEV